MEKVLKISPKMLAIVVTVAILVLVVATCQWRAGEERRREEEIATAEGLAQVVSTTFEGRTDLKVSNIRGSIDVTSVNRGRIFDSALDATLPYSVDYFVDLSGLGPANARFDTATRTLLMDIPDVRISEPNIDLTKGKVGEAEGILVSRRASANLVNRALKLSRAKADQNARLPENLNRARQEAKVRTAALLQVPLNSAGLEDIKVVVRLAGEARKDDPSYLDLSATYDEAIEEARRRRAGEKSQ
jgi:hypothetical protein